MQPVDNNSFFHRNLLWVSPELLETIKQVRLAVVGCGGNGVIFIVNAAHIGFRNFTICDPDILDATNLNRYVIASPDQVSHPKTEIIRTYLISRFPEITVQAIQKAFPNPDIVSAISTSDIVIGCLDNTVPRIELNIVSRKYQRTLIDLGSGFIVDDTAGPSGNVLAAGGQISISRPTGPCLRCLGFDVEGTQNSYFIEDDAPDASSLVLNNVVGALAVEALISEIVNELSPVNRINYDRSSLSITQEALLNNPECSMCGAESTAHIFSIAEKESLKAFFWEKGIVCKTV